MKHHPFTQSFEQLPKSLPVFPLSGAVVLPGSYLPLNIFEPRYLRMVHDAMRSNQLIGMVQPKNDDTTPDLYTVGCAGRISRYEEVQGGRLEIMLTGLCRFAITEELQGLRGYRIIKPDWQPYASDYEPDTQDHSQNKVALLAALKAYFENNSLDTDWEVMEKLEASELVNNLFGFLPLQTDDKQLLIESATTEDRIKSFIAILDRDQDDTQATRH